VDNFAEMLWSPVFWVAAKNTFIYVAMALLMGFAAPIVLALMLDELPKGSLLFRVLFYLPTVTSPLVIMMLWKMFYYPDATGLFNSLLAPLGVPTQHWLRDPRLAMACVIVPGIWGGIGAGAVLYLAALRNVPLELYEAASIDGAGLWHKIRHITLPTLKTLIRINFIGAFIGAFHATERILVMTAGGPAHATHVLGLEVFQNAFIYLKYGYATAVAWTLGSLLVGFTVYQLKILRNVHFSTAKE
jgi:ABC-type sugar transport system permease subunit